MATYAQQYSVHGSLARAGKVKGQTPKVQKKERKKRAEGQRYKPNTQPMGKMG
eukprot:gene25184-5371_t